MQNTPLRVLVTGANKGIGYGIVERALIESQGDQEAKYHLIMTARSLVNGEMAVKDLQEKYPAAANIEVIQLDLMSPESIAGAVAALKQSGPVDILVNNAGWWCDFKDQDNDELVKTFETTTRVNYLATRAFTDALLREGLVKANGKIVNVSSQYCKLRWNEKLDQAYLDKLRHFKNPEKLTFEEFTKLAESLVDDIIAKAKDSSIPKAELPPPYRCAKMLLSIYTFFLGKDPSVVDKNIQVYSCHPGQAKTGMNPVHFKVTYLEAADNVFHFFRLKPEIDLSIQGEFFSDSRTVEQLSD